MEVISRLLAGNAVARVPHPVGGCGTDNLQESFFGARMYWSHYDANTNLQMLNECGFSIIWSRIVPDPIGGAHLFVLAQKD